MTERIHIEETTVGYVPGVAVGVGNIFVRDIEDAQGRAYHGPTATLALRPDDPALPESTVRAYPGLELELGGSRYQIAEIGLQSAGSDNGYVVLVPVDVTR